MSAGHGPRATQGDVAMNFPGRSPATSRSSPRRNGPELTPRGGGRHNLPRAAGRRAQRSAGAQLVRQELPLQLLRRRRSVQLRDGAHGTGRRLVGATGGSAPRAIWAPMAASRASRSSRSSRANRASRASPARPAQPGSISPSNRDGGARICTEHGKTRTWTTFRSSRSDIGAGTFFAVASRCGRARPHRFATPDLLFGAKIRGRGATHGPRAGPDGPRLHGRVYDPCRPGMPQATPWRDSLQSSPSLKYAR